MEHIGKLILTNQAPVRPESKPSPAGEERALSAALVDTRISECEAETIFQALRYAMIKIGLRAANLPDEQEAAVLLAHIVQNYGGHTPAEIRLAFDMALSGSLDVEVNSYENFSCMYFSSIMNAYRTWSKQASKHVLNESPKSEIKPLTDEEMQTFIQSYKGQKTDVRLLPEFLYQWLVEKGEIGDDWQDQDTIAQAVALRKAEILRALENDPSSRSLMYERLELKRMLKAGFLEGQEKVRVESLAKKIIIREYLQFL